MIGQQIGQYMRQDREGGMGTVFEAVISAEPSVSASPSKSSTRNKNQQIASRFVNEARHQRR